MPERKCLSGKRQIKTIGVMKTKKVQNMQRMDGHDSARTIAEEAERCYLMLLSFENADKSRCA